MVILKTNFPTSSPARYQRVEILRRSFHSKRAAGSENEAGVACGTRVAAMAAAAILERHPSLTVTDIAHDLGFSSSQYFATVFRRYLGVSAGDYRKQTARTGYPP